MKTRYVNRNGSEQKRIQGLLSIRPSVHGAIYVRFVSGRERSRSGARDMPLQPSWILGSLSFSNETTKYNRRKCIMDKWRRALGACPWNYAHGITRKTGRPSAWAKTEPDAAMLVADRPTSFWTGRQSVSLGERRKVRYVVIEGTIGIADRQTGTGGKVGRRCCRAVGQIFHAGLDLMRKHIISDRDLPT